MSIRLARKDDLEQIRNIYAPYVSDTAVSFEYEVPSPEEFEQRFFAITAQFPWLVWEESGQILGYAYGSAPFERAAYQWCAESSIYLASDARRRGIGRKLQTALELILKQQGYRLLYALITSENEPSLAFHRALGFSDCAIFENCGYKFGRLHSVIWLKKELNSVETTTLPPSLATSVVNTDGKFTEILDKISLS